MLKLLREIYVLTANYVLYLDFSLNLGNEQEKGKSQKGAQRRAKVPFKTGDY